VGVGGGFWGGGGGGFEPRGGRIERGREYVTYQNRLLKKKDRGRLASSQITSLLGQRRRVGNELKQKDYYNISD